MVLVSEARKQWGWVRCPAGHRIGDDANQRITEGFDRQHRIRLAAESAPSLKLLGQATVLAPDARSALGSILALPQPYWNPDTFWFLG